VACKFGGKALNHWECLCARQLLQLLYRGGEATNTSLHWRVSLCKTLFFVMHAMHDHKMTDFGSAASQMNSWHCRASQQCYRGTQYTSHWLLMQLFQLSSSNSGTWVDAHAVGSNVAPGTWQHIEGCYYVLCAPHVSCVSTTGKPPSPIQYVQKLLCEACVICAKPSDKKECKDGCLKVGLWRSHRTVPVFCR
jgi:hypothetical protein